MRQKLLCFSAVTLFLGVMPSSAANIDFPCGFGGVVNETSNGKPAVITINLTNADRNISNPDPKYGFPKKITLNGSEMPPFTARVGIGSLEGNPSRLNGFPGVCDVKQTTQILKGSGEIADLDLESVFHDPDTNRLLIQGLFGTINGKLGPGLSVRVPDLFGDTNGDGSLDDGDILYSMVDINQFLNQTPSFSLGDTVQIRNGLVSSLPGMFFSLTPITYDPDTGFAGTPANLDGTVEAFHELTPEVPEPSSLMLTLTAAFTALGLIYRKTR